MTTAITKQLTATEIAKSEAARQLRNVYCKLAIARIKSALAGIGSNDLFSIGILAACDLEILRMHAEAPLFAGPIVATRKVYVRQRRRIFRRDGGKCVYCGSANRLTIDHKIPLSRFGHNEDTNLVTACWSCNKEKGMKTYDEYLSIKGAQ